MLTFRKYGNTKNPTVILLHGGPAALGTVAPIAEELAGSFHVLEPFQRGSGKTPLTVKTHIKDLHQFIREQSPLCKPSLAGESWGAMLALAYGAAYPDTLKSLTLIGCGTFDKTSRAQMGKILESRMTDEHQKALNEITQSSSTPQQQLLEKYKIIQAFYDYAPIPHGNNMEGEFDSKAHTETWEDMLRQQELGVYPSSFTRINCPVSMIHGDYDPHPGSMIRDSLLPYIPQLKYYELKKCGHSPWYETYAREAFFHILKSSF